MQASSALSESNFHRLAEELAGRQVDELTACRGGRNSRVYRVRCGDVHFALKRYPDVAGSLNDRFDTEIKALGYYARNANLHVPRLVAVDQQHRLALLEWLDGHAVTAPSMEDLHQAIAFIADTHKRESNGGGAFELATESCLSGEELVGHIERRLERLQAVTEQERVLGEFIHQQLLPELESCLQQARRGLPNFAVPLAQGQRSLIPADFGFHNALKAADEKLYFLDFEYFGWDDPVRLAADFLLHPGMTLNEHNKTLFRQGMIDIFRTDMQFERRLKHLLPLYGIRWALILLNEFLPERWQARVFAGETADWQEIKDAQLMKAQTTLNEVRRCLAF